MQSFKFAVAFAMALGISACTKSSDSAKPKGPVQKGSQEIAGSYYQPYVDNGGGDYQPEELVTLNADGTYEVLAVHNDLLEVSRGIYAVEGKRITIDKPVYVSKCDFVKNDDKVVTIGWNRTPGKLVLSEGSDTITWNDATAEQIKKVQDVPLCSGGKYTPAVAKTSPAPGGVGQDNGTGVVGDYYIPFEQKPGEAGYTPESLTSIKPDGTYEKYTIHDGAAELARGTYKVNGNTATFSKGEIVAKCPNLFNEGDEEFTAQFSRTPTTLTLSAQGQTMSINVATQAQVTQVKSYPLCK